LEVSEPGGEFGHRHGFDAHMGCTYTFTLVVSLVFHQPLQFFGNFHYNLL
jgi:hypothetical protein